MTRMWLCILAVNVVAFCVCRFLLHDGAVAQTLMRFFALVGGAPGVLLAVWKQERSNIKEIAMTRVFVICVGLIELIAMLFWFGLKDKQLTFDMIGFFIRYPLIPLWILVANIATFVLYWDDKRRAGKNGERHSIVKLLGFAAAGGSIGALAGMYVFRHKTQKDYFTVGVPMILLTQALFLFWLMNIMA
ncbi:MAG: DUF1294 domain-containing protein [Clostridia bacterium]|nr:DUF1294 domain-containing protein [Clostridia bacterium]